MPWKDEIVRNVPLIANGEWPFVRSLLFGSGAVVVFRVFTAAAARVLVSALTSYTCTVVPGPLLLVELLLLLTTMMMVMRRNDDGDAGDDDYDDDNDGD